MQEKPSKTLTQRLFALVFYASILALIYLATSKQVQIVQISHFDKVQHLLAFGWLTTTAFLAWRQLAIQRFAIIFMISLCIELAQLFISYRSASWHDLLANAGGILLAEVIFVRFLKRFTS